MNSEPLLPNKEYIYSAIFILILTLTIFSRWDGVIYLGIIALITYELLSKQLTKKLFLQCTLYLISGLLLIYILLNHVFTT